jgi:bifunctional DNase/RNase
MARAVLVAAPHGGSLMTTADQSGTEIATAETSPAARGLLIEIGKSVFPVYGDSSSGWSIDRRDITELTPYRYSTLDELVFALFNLSLHISGDAKH